MTSQMLIKPALRSKKRNPKHKTISFSSLSCISWREADNDCLLQNEPATPASCAVGQVDCATARVGGGGARVQKSPTSTAQHTALACVLAAADAGRAACSGVSHPAVVRSDPCRLRNHHPSGSGYIRAARPYPSHHRLLFVGVISFSKSLTFPTSTVNFFF